MDSFNYIFTKFGGRKSGSNYRTDCKECNCKKSLVWQESKPHPFHCKACGYSGNVFTLGFTDQNKRHRDSDMTLEERFKAIWRKKGWASKYPHRLSDRVVHHFGLQYKLTQSQKSVNTYVELQFLGPGGRILKRNSGYDKNWIAPKGGSGEFWLNTSRIADNPPGSAIFVCAGEWDLFALWEHTGINGISPTSGETNAPKKVDDLELFAGRHVVILYDNDTAGRKGGKQLARSILRHVKTKSVKVLDMAALGGAKVEGGSDLDDYFSQGGTKERLAAEIRSTPVFDSNRQRAPRASQGVPREPVRSFG